MRILPALPATPPPALGSGIAGTGSPTLGRAVDARIVTPVAGDLYQAVAGQLQLQVRSTVPLLPGQPIRLHLHGNGQATVVPDEVVPDTPTAPPPGNANTASVQTQLSARGQLLASAAQALPPQPGNPLPAAVQTPASAAPTLATPAAASHVPAAAGHLPAGSAPLPSLAAMTTPGTMPSRTDPSGAGTQPAATRLYRELSASLTTPPAQTAAATATPATPVTDGNPLPGSRGDIASQARGQLQSLLPRQHDPSRLVSLLQALTPALQAAGDNDSPLLQAARQLLNSLPTSGQMMTSAGVLGSLQRSGLLAPDRDSASSGKMPSDLKQALTQLAEVARSLPVEAVGQRSAPAGHLQPLHTPTLTPPADDGTLQRMLMQLAAEAEPVQARIESHQLLHLQQDPQTPQWLFELPLRHGQHIDLWQCQIQREAPRQGVTEETPAWQLTLAVDMADQGPLMIRLGLQGQQLWIHFHADSSATQQQIQQHLGDLQSALRDKGVTPSQLACHLGLPHPDALPDPPHHVMETTA